MFEVLLFILFVTPEIVGQRNDYLQFLTYSKNISRYNPNHWRDTFDNCVDQAAPVGSNPYPSIGCMIKLQEAIRHRDPTVNDRPHWISPFNHTLPNCQYEVKQIPTSSNTIFLHLRIRQDNCSNKSIQEAHPGGSSFYVLSEGLFQQTCEVHDSRDHYYDVICFHQPLFMFRILPVGNSRNTHHLTLESRVINHGHDYHQNEWLKHHNYCQRITVILDYEHYDAYSEYGAYIGSAYPLLRYQILDRELFCASEVSILPQTLAVIPVVAALLKDDAIMSNEITNGCWRLKEERTSLLANDSMPVYTSFDYEWKWETEFNDLYRHVNFSTDIHSLVRNNSHNATLDYLFLGESHLRYLKDFLLCMVDPPEMKTVAHSHHKYKNFQFRFTPFNYNLKEGIQNHCNAATENLMIITQTGAWDLAFSFLSQTLKYPKAASDLMSLMKELILPVAIPETRLWFEEALGELQVHSKHWLHIASLEANCHEHLQHLIWLDVMLYPTCDLIRDRKLDSAEVALCKQQKLGRNNYNIPALSFFYEQSLANMEQVRQRLLINASQNNHLSPFSEQHKKIHLLQTRKIFLPRLLSTPSKQGHFMSRTDFTSSVKTGEEGEILVAALLRLLHFLK